jgi:aminopeptidase
LRICLSLTVVNRWGIVNKMSKQSYTPSQDVLNKYAKVLINFALWSGEGIKPGDVVYIMAPISALPLYREVVKVITDSGGLVISGLSDDAAGLSKYVLEHSTDKQLSTFLEKYYKGLADQIDHRVALLAEHDIHELDGVDPQKIMLTQKVRKPLAEWLEKKELDGKHTWTIGLYGTPAMAKEAGMSQEEYWDQIIKAVYLDEDDPIAHWQQNNKEIGRLVNTLNDLELQKVHVTGEDVNLHVTIGEKRRWLGGSGRNIPSFEVFTSPDWRGTEGWIRFNQPLYRHGAIATGIELHFEKGRVVKAKAKTGEKFLKQMLATDEGASQVGEFSLTDSRMSRIDKFMANTLFDENIGGRFGNTHIAVGKSYRDSYAGDTAKTAKATYKKLGFNESAIHTDMVSTANRTVSATLKDGSQKIIYTNGQFTL